MQAFRRRQIWRGYRRGTSKSAHRELPTSDPHSIEIFACRGNALRTRHPTLRTCISFFPVVHVCNVQLYQTIKDVRDSYDALVELLESIEHFLSRLDIYTKITPTAAMTEVLVKILVEILSTLASAIKDVKQGKPSKSLFRGRIRYYMTLRDTEKFVKKLFGEKDTEAVLQRLNRLTEYEAKLTAAQILEVVHGLVQNMTVVTDGEQIYQSCHSRCVDSFFLDSTSSLDCVRNVLGMFLRLERSIAASD